MNLFKKLFAPIILLFRRRIRRKWRRYTFMNRELLSPHPGRVPLPPGTYRFKHEWWRVWGRPKVGETATEYFAYVRKNGKILRTEIRSEVVEKTK